MIDAKPRGILGDDRVARAPAQHRVVAVAQPGRDQLRLSQDFSASTTEVSIWRLGTDQ
jgi:hypothetical protein